MKTLNYKIDNNIHSISVADSPPFKYGNKELLSQYCSDITYKQKWYEEGYKSVNFINSAKFESLKTGLTNCIKNIIFSELGIAINGFKLRNYHHWVKTDENHYKVVAKTSDLFSKDFNFPIYDIIPNFERILGFNLTDIDPHNGLKVHIIIRINRPLSCDYNPPHKDIYQGVDNDSYIPQFINFWVPVCGVSQKSTLPIVPFSHQIPEDQILRTFEGAVLGRNKYRVRMIKEWAGSNCLTRPKVNYGEVLIFSSHLIHGFAINEQSDKTRVSLEFRLFKKS